MPDPTTSPTPDVSTAVNDLVNQQGAPVTPELRQQAQQILARYYKWLANPTYIDQKDSQGNTVSVPVDPTTGKPAPEMYQIGSQLTALDRMAGGTGNATSKVVKNADGTTSLVIVDPVTHQPTVSQISGNTDLVTAQVNLDNANAADARARAGGTLTPQQQSDLQAQKDAAQKDRDLSVTSATGHNAVTVANIQAASSASNTVQQGKNELANTQQQGSNELATAQQNGQNNINTARATAQAGLESQQAYLDAQLKAGTLLPADYAKALDAAYQQAYAYVQGVVTQENNRYQAIVNLPTTAANINLSNAQATSDENNAATNANTQQQTARQDYAKTLMDTGTGVLSALMEGVKNGYSPDEEAVQAAFSPINAAYQALAQGIHNGSVNPQYVPNSPYPSRESLMPPDVSAPPVTKIPDKPTPNTANLPAGVANAPGATTNVAAPSAPTGAPTPTAPAAPVDTSAPLPGSSGGMIGNAPPPAPPRPSIGNPQPGMPASGSDAAQGTGAPLPTADDDENDPTKRRQPAGVGG